MRERLPPGARWRCLAVVDSGDQLFTAEEFQDRFLQVIRTRFLHLRSAAGAKDFHYEVLNNPRLSPVAIMATVFNALHGVNEYGEEITYRLNGSINVDNAALINYQAGFTSGGSSHGVVGIEVWGGLGAANYFWVQNVGVL